MAAQCGHCGRVVYDVNHDCRPLQLDREVAALRTALTRSQARERELIEALEIAREWIAWAVHTRDLPEPFVTLTTIDTALAALAAEPVHEETK